MPKIIENPEHRLKEEARRQINASGYAGMTVRSVAAACGIGVGTVYHYYPSKDALIAAFMLEDWQRCMDAVRAVSADAASPESVVRSIYDQLLLFADENRAVIRDKSAAAAFAGAFGRYHALLREQLAQPLLKFCADPFAADFIAESLLTWTMAGTDFDALSRMISKLF